MAGGHQEEASSVNYFIKKTIITDNLFGVDIMEEAVEIAKLRLFLTLVAAANSVNDLEPSPTLISISCRELTGRLMHVEDKESRSATRGIVPESYREILAEKNRLIAIYRHATSYAEDLRSCEIPSRRTKRSC